MGKILQFTFFWGMFEVVAAKKRANLRFQTLTVPQFARRLWMIAEVYSRYLYFGYDHR